MFDDYVEHAVGDHSAHVESAAPLPKLQYEGFEPLPYEPDDARASIEDGRDVVSEANAPVAPVFELGRVQYAFPAPLVSFVVSSDMLAMGLVSNTIVLIELSRADQVVKVQIPRKPTEMLIYKLFMDPSGKHIIITSEQAENWYLHRSWKKPRQLKGFKMVIESIAWNKAALLSSTHSTSTREILIGARSGTIFEAVLDAEEDFFKSHERYLQPVFSLPERHSITGIRFDYFPSDPKQALVLVTTPTRIYQFSGTVDKKADDAGRVFSSLFAAYRETAPINPDQAMSLPKKMAWMTGPGIYHGTLNFETEPEDHIDAAALLPYPTFPMNENSETPLSLSLTEFHFLLLYQDKVVGICNLDDTITYEESLPLKPNEVVLGLSADPVRRTYWVYTNQSLFELVIGNEDRDVWKIYLEKGQFEIALRYAKTARQRDQILFAQANHLFLNAQYFPAAQCYAHCSATFEEVALKFLDVGERDSLRSYLISRLERTRKTDLTQRMILATWLVEFYLSKCNELDDIVASESISQDVNNLQAERLIVEEDLRQFFETYKNNLDKDTVYELIQGHGRTDMYIFYATTIGDFERVIEHYVMEEEWVKAIEVISRQSNLELYYRFGPTLMHQVPKETVDSWLRQPSLNPLRLVPSILQLQHSLRDPLSPNHAIRYLNHIIFDQNNTSPTIHNLLITFYASPPSYTPSDDDGPLLRFLSTAPSDPITGKPYYDLDYALRLCKLSGRTQPCVHIYSKMGLWENSVDLALEKGDLELAKINADMPEDDPSLRKKLWLKIARYVVQDKKDIKSAMRFLENADLLKIEDILPFFPDFVVIDDFKEEIAHALEGYSAQIDALKAEMDEATQTAESIKQDIAALKNRFITIDANEKCSNCSNLLLSRQFYVFPCHHTFHADCLIGLAKEYLPPHALRRIITLQNELMKDSPRTRGNVSKPSLMLTQPPNGRQPMTQRTLLSANFGPIVSPLQNGAKAANMLGRSVMSAGDRLRDLIIPDALATLVSSPNWLPGIGGSNRLASEENTPSHKKLESIRVELEELLSSSCPLCEGVVAGLDKPFIAEGELGSSWTL
ncbi:Vacuolar protein sorting-associated protein 18-like protein [Psilocybe cubensis]|uniref:Vacuolar protein sorting-associated protein 18-like protein n=1 Tax=Psilocybe cubensis TaxID=181762 RepID=A0ACB8HFQ6_PSICU|nr:Vacuolar protein sorting-associated protein 18-like protein [Psilocybe cubensis]KAH9486613.1 Vacuolar protein sorting-associated protein 18-like protein [Psilocybe cubensis]